MYTFGFAIPIIINGWVTELIECLPRSVKLAGSSHGYSKPKALQFGTGCFLARRQAALHVRGYNQD